MNQIFEKVLLETKELQNFLVDKEIISQKAKEFQREFSGRPFCLLDLNYKYKKFTELPERLSNKGFDNIEWISDIRESSVKLVDYLSQKIKNPSKLSITIEQALQETKKLFELVSNDEQQWGIYDSQRNEFREEVYSSREEALASFSEYWKEIVFSDVMDTFDFEDYKSKHGINRELTETEEDKIVTKYLSDWNNEEFLEWYEMEIRRLK